jgi:hypothetical protein
MCGIISVINDLQVIAPTGPQSTLSKSEGLYHPVIVWLVWLPVVVTAWVQPGLPPEHDANLSQEDQC